MRISPGYYLVSKNILRLSSLSKHIGVKPIIRQVSFFPYSDPSYPSFTLILSGTLTIHYQLIQKDESGETSLFEGDDIKLSPLYDIDSDQTIKTYIDFLTNEYKRSDSPKRSVQSLFFLHHAEILSILANEGDWEEEG